MNNLPLRLTAFTWFLSLGTYLLYNFHRISFKLDYSDSKSFYKSITNKLLERSQQVVYLFVLVILIVLSFFLNIEIYFLLIPLAFLAIAYSVPLLRSRKKKIKVTEVYLLKTPVLAVVWGVSTTLIPLIEQNVSIESSFVWLQVISRCLFMFALCIPFEMRDIDTDAANNIRTYPVVFGLKATKILGSAVLFLEIISHHLMHSLSLDWVMMLDVTSLVAFAWILLQHKNRSPYYYKFFIDGTMLLRFVLLLIVSRYS